MGDRKIVVHPRSSRMRSTYLFSGWIAGLAVYGIAILVLRQLPGSPGLWTLVLIGLSFMGALYVGNQIWRRMWTKFECPGCGAKLRLKNHRLPDSKRWGYQCNKCDTFFDAGIAVRTDLS